MESKCYKFPDGKYWKNSEGQLHRENDLPAYEGISGRRGWYINGKMHRELGPAEIYSNGEEFWCLNSVEYLPEDMPHFLYIEYLKWEYKKKNGI